MANFFLDTSALAKLYHKETGLDYVLQQPSNRSMISPLSIVEMESVSAIKVRSDQLDNSGMVIVRRRLRADLAQRRIWSLHQFRKNIFMVHGDFLPYMVWLKVFAPWMNCNCQLLLISNTLG